MSATAVPIDVRGERWRLRVRNARSFARRFASRSDGVIGLLILVFFVLLALFPETFVGKLETATTASGLPLEPPSAAHLFGTDDLGRDILNQTVHGARISMTVGVFSTLAPCR